MRPPLAAARMWEEAQPAEEHMRPPLAAARMRKEAQPAALQPRAVAAQALRAETRLGHRKSDRTLLPMEQKRHISCRSRPFEFSFGVQPGHPRECARNSDGPESHEPTRITNIASTAQLGRNRLCVQNDDLGQSAGGAGAYRHHQAVL